MTKMESVDHDGWNEIAQRASEKLQSNIPSGELCIHLVQQESVRFHYSIGFSLSGGTLTCEAICWPWAHEYQRWKAGVSFVPYFAAAVFNLTDEERNYFPEFFDLLLKEHEGQMLEPIAGWLLDGSDYYLRMYRRGELVRTIEWTSHKQTRGVMQQMMLLAEKAMTIVDKKITG